MFPKESPRSRGIQFYPASPNAILTQQYKSSGIQLTWVLCLLPWRNHTGPRSWKLISIETPYPSRNQPYNKTPRSAEKCVDLPCLGGCALALFGIHFWTSLHVISSDVGEGCTSQSAYPLRGCDTPKSCWGSSRQGKKARRKEAEPKM